MCSVETEWEWEEGSGLILREYLPSVRRHPKHSPLSNSYQLSFYFYPKMTLPGKYSLHFVGQETEAQQDYVSCPEPCN